VIDSQPPVQRHEPIIGINSNVVVDSVSFHVQSEDLWPKTPQIVTHVFREGGVVVKVAKLDYSNHLNKPNFQAVLVRVMKAHHLKILRKIQRGRMDSIPPSIVMRPTTSDEDERLLAAPSFPKNPLPSRLNPISAAASNEVTPRESTSSDDSSPDSVAHVWDRLVAEAQRSRLTETANKRHETDEPSAAVWDRVVKSHRRTHIEQDDDTTEPTSTDGLANDAYTQGLSSLRASDAVAAVVALARAVQLAPFRRQYRAALRRALDFLDEQP
jgi:hypothetical protein